MRARGWHLLAACAAVAAAACGCHSAPKTFAESGLKEPGGIEEHVELYWLARSLEKAPAAEGGKRPRVAIVECSVHFITHKFAGFLEREGVVGTSEIGRYSVVPAIFGLGRVSIRYGDELKKRLPGEMRAMLAKELEQAGFEVVPHEEVSAARAYRRFLRGRAGAQMPLYLFNFFATDTGRVKSAETWPADGLAVLTGAKDGGIRDAARGVMRETGADVAIRARFWVGVWRGRASVERSSRIDVITAGDTGSLISEKSLVSEETVIDPQHFELFRGEVQEVVGEQYSLAMSYLVPPYVEMAVTRWVAGRACGRESGARSSAAGPWEDRWAARLRCARPSVVRRKLMEALRELADSAGLGGRSAPRSAARGPRDQRSAGLSPRPSVVGAGTR